MTRRWRQQKERGSLWAVQTILWVALHIGRGGARLLLWPITGYFFLFAPRVRRASLRYLNRVLPRKAGYRDVARHIHCFSATILDRVYFLAGQFDRFDIRVHGADDLLNEQRGVLLLGAHHGSFDALRTLAISREGLAVKVLMYPQHNEQLSTLLDSLAPELRESIIPLGEPFTLFKVQEALEGGAMVGMLGDRLGESDKQVTCELLGREAVFPAGPLLLAAALKVPVYLVFGLYRGANRYEVYCERFAERVAIERRARDEQARQWVGRYVARLEHYVNLAPYNWFNFYDFWDEEGVA